MPVGRQEVMIGPTEPVSIDPGHDRPVDQELFDRTAPGWNCVAYADGPHYVDAKSGICLWCGQRVGNPD